MRLVVSLKVSKTNWCKSTRLHALFVVQCSATCGEGVQLRNVTCPHEGLCDEDEKPLDKRLCDAGPCLQWVTDSWGQVCVYHSHCRLSVRPSVRLSVCLWRCTLWRSGSVWGIESCTIEFLGRCRCTLAGWVKRFYEFCWSVNMYGVRNYWLSQVEKN